MVKKSTRKKAKKQSFLGSLPNKVWFRPAVLAVIACVIGGFVYVSSQNPGNQNNARQAADAFAKAVETCDIDTAKKYYLALQTNPDKEKDFREKCKPGSKITFNREIKTPGTTDDPNNIGLIYNTVEPDGRTAQVMIYLVYVKEDSQWYVLSLTATSF
jgi:hypothetical protein